MSQYSNEKRRRIGHAHYQNIRTYRQTNSNTHGSEKKCCFALIRTGHCPRNCLAKKCHHQFLCCGFFGHSRVVSQGRVSDRHGQHIGRVSASRQSRFKLATRSLASLDPFARYAMLRCTTIALVTHSICVLVHSNCGLTYSICRLAHSI